MIANIILLFTDTDVLKYETETQNVYDLLIKVWF